MTVLLTDLVYFECAAKFTTRFGFLGAGFITHEDTRSTMEENGTGGNFFVNASSTKPEKATVQDLFSHYQPIDNEPIT